MKKKRKVMKVNDDDKCVQICVGVEKKKKYHPRQEVMRMTPWTNSTSSSSPEAMITGD